MENANRSDKLKRTFFLKRLALLLIVLIIPLVVVGILSTVVSKSYIDNDIKNNNMSMFKQTCKTIELIFKAKDHLWRRIPYKNTQ